jgi:peptidylprolyl isomerase
VGEVVKNLFYSFLALFLGAFFVLQAGEKPMQHMSEPKIIVMETNLGSIEIRLFPEQAPKTCENFLGLIAQNYYNGVIFHRVIKSFMIQGGDPTGTGRGGKSLWGKGFADECTPTLKFNKPGLLAMANSGPNTNGSQFFITTVPTPWLDGKHTIFGEVVRGYEVVQKIENAKTEGNDRPVSAISIIKISVNTPPAKVGGF